MRRRRWGVAPTMARHARIFTVSLVSAIGTWSAVADAHVVRASRGGANLRHEGAPVGHRAAPAEGPHRGSHGSTVIADAHGLLVAERNAGVLVRTDRMGVPLADLELHEGVSQVVADDSGAVFVADRLADRVVRVEAPEDHSLAVVGEISIAEPHGLALTPDGSTLLATSVADHALVAVDARELRELWRVKLTAEPRGVAVSADGREATVGFLSSGALAVVELASKGERVHWRALEPRDRVALEDGEDGWGDFVKVATIREARSRFEVPIETGRRRARNVFSVAYLGHGLVAAPHQLSTPQMKRIPSREMQDSYGGGPESVPAIVHRLAIVDAPARETAKTGFSQLEVHQPRAVTYDVRRDTLLVGGFGDDRIVAVADVSSPAPYLAWTAELSRADATRPHLCGIDGLAVDGDDIWIHCELTRRLFRLQPERMDLDDKSWKREKDGVLVGPELAASLRPEQVERGAELFRRGHDWRISDLGVMACASCHPEGRQDGLSWRLGKSIVQTPMLAGRIAGTAPYKWSGADEDLKASFRHTIERLGGSEWRTLSRAEIDALAAYVESLPAPRAPTVNDADAVARGRSLFHDDLDCGACHSGEKLTDQMQYPFDSRGLDETDTPSLVGVAHTAPYYHDGSARDLYALLTDKGNVHDMTDLSSLDADQIADLTAYLESL
jgi:mono/diheme cytochrome c family protein